MILKVLWKRYSLRIFKHFQNTCSLFSVHFRFLFFVDNRNFVVVVAAVVAAVVAGVVDAVDAAVVVGCCFCCCRLTKFNSYAL